LPLVILIHESWPLKSDSTKLINILKFYPRFSHSPVLQHPRSGLPFVLSQTLNSCAFRRYYLRPQLTPRSRYFPAQNSRISPTLA
jgi:hypothetical protein